MYYEMVNKYNILLEDYSFNKEDTIIYIEYMLIEYLIERNIFHDYDKTDFNKDNILNYISYLEILDYVYEAHIKIDNIKEFTLKNKEIEYVDICYPSLKIKNTY